MRIDTLKKILRKAGIEYHIPTNNNEIVVCCLNPECSDDTGHMYINAVKGVFNCFKCGWSGRVYKLLKDYITDEDYEDEEEEEVVQTEFSGVKLPVGYYPLTGTGLNYRKCLKYLFSRGIEINDIADYDIGYTHFGKYAGRIIFPIRNDGVLVSYIGRAVNPHLQPKVLNASRDEAFSPSRFLYNFDRARFFESLVITEGVFDCLTLKEFDYKYGTVASFGKKLTKDQVDLIYTGSFKEIIFAWDADAIDVILQYAANFRGLIDVKVAFFPDGDVNDVGREKAMETIRKALPVCEVEVDLLLGGIS